METAEQRTLWRVDLLGKFCVTNLQSGQTITRFRTQKTGALLAYLAYHPDKPHSREALIDLLWPDARMETGRHNLSNALTALRRQFETADVPAGSVFTASRFTIQFHSAAVATDVAAFERSLQSAAQAEGRKAKQQWLTQILDGYGGVLLPGYYEDWIIPEQQRLQETFFAASRQLASLLTQAGEMEQAIETARRAVRLDPAHEENNRLLMELLAEAGRPAAALRQYREFARVLETQGEAPPAQATRQFVQGLLLKKAPEKPSLAAAASRASGYVPARLTRFFGRSVEQTRLRDLLAMPETRLLTLVGPGGIGKTRLALEVADSLKPVFGAVWFAPLSDVTAAENLNSVALAWMDAPPSPQSDAQRLIEILSRQRSLLVLDNFEHLIEDGALWVQTLLERVPTLTCLVTSRQRLLLSGETLFHVAPLPSSGGATTPEATLQNESVRLFVDRAQAVRTDFAVTPQNASAIAELCDRLEGIPLALELAAARAQTFTPQQMLEQMKQRFDFLVSRHYDRAQRHRTLRDTLEWSYRLLTPQAQSFFARLSVFCGGWTWEAAQTICAEDGENFTTEEHRGEGEGKREKGKEAVQNPKSKIQNLDDPKSKIQNSDKALDLLTQLSDASLLTAEEVGAEIRFRMLETMREFAREQCAEEAFAALSRRHTAYFSQLAKQAEPELKGQQQADWLQRLEREHDNFCAALIQCQQSEAEDDKRTGLEIAAALWRFWYVRGHLSEGRKWFRLLLPSAPPDKADALQAKAWNSAGCLAWGQNDLDAARKMLETSLGMQRKLGDAIRIASALNNLGLVARAQGDCVAAICYHREALDIQRQNQDWREVALSLNNLANVHAERGDDLTAQALYSESVELWRKLEDKWGLALALSNLGSVSQRLGQYDTSRAFLMEGLAIRRQLNDKTGTAMSLTTLGMLACETRNFAAAANFHAEALRLHRKIANPRYLTEALHAAGDCFLARNLLTDAAAHYAEAWQTYRRIDAADNLGLECLERAARFAAVSGAADRAARFRETAADLKQKLKNNAAASDFLPTWNRALKDAAVFAERKAV